MPSHNRVSCGRPPSRRLRAPPPRPLRAHPPSTAPTDDPPNAPRPRPATHGPALTARATQATNPPEMHLRPPRPAACHGHGHPRGLPSAARPWAPRGGRDSAASASDVPSCVGRAGLDRCARGCAGAAAAVARNPTRPRPRAPAPGSAGCGPGAETAASPRAVAAAPSPPPAPRRTRPLRARPLRPPATEHAVAERCRGAAGSLVRQWAGTGRHSLPPGSFTPVPAGSGP